MFGRPSWRGLRDRSVLTGTPETRTRRPSRLTTRLLAGLTAVALVGCSAQAGQPTVGGAPAGAPAGAAAPVAGGGRTEAGIPASTANEPTGNFRTQCGFSHFAYDDPIVYPGQVGASHLHMFFGNTLAGANSTYDSLMTSGESTCGGGIANRSAYWTPAVLSGGNAIVPEYVTVYYKGNGPAAADIQRIQPFPPGLRMIAGFDPARPGDGPRWNWQCEGGGKQSTIPNCGAGTKVGVFMSFPNCWDGVNLDSANHRDHMAYQVYAGGPAVCPPSHPVMLPQYSLGVWFTSDGNSQAWTLSSDGMWGTANGASFHADWFGAWDRAIEQTWVTQCINAMRDCKSGQLGDGTALGGASAVYTGPKVVAIP